MLVVRNPPTNAGYIIDMGSVPALGRSPGGGNGNPLQYSCLENPMDRGAWWATVHGVAKSWTRLKQLSTHALFTQIKHKKNKYKNKEGIFSFTVQSLGNDSSTIRQLAYRSWHQVNRQEELLMGGSGGGGK